MSLRDREGHPRRQNIDRKEKSSSAKAIPVAIDALPVPPTDGAAREALVYFGAAGTSEGAAPSVPCTRKARGVIPVQRLKAWMKPAASE